MPGKVFSEQIADMIKSGCRKTIVLLSEDYLKSEWCSYEARMALHESPGVCVCVVCLNLPLYIRKVEALYSGHRL